MRTRDVSAAQAHVPQLLGLQRSTLAVGMCKDDRDEMKVFADAYNHQFELLETHCPDPDLDLDIDEECCLSGNCIENLENVPNVPNLTVFICCLKLNFWMGKNIKYVWT